MAEDVTRRTLPAGAGTIAAGAAAAGPASGPGRKNTDPSARKAVFEVGGALLVAD